MTASFFCPFALYASASVGYGWIVLAIVVVVGLAVGIPLWMYARSHEWTDDAFIDAHTVTVSPQVAGHVIRLLVDDNQEVKEGQLLVQIDSRDFQDTLAEAEALAGDVRMSMNADVAVDPAELFEHVYAQPTANLERQRAALLAELAEAEEPAR